MERSFKVKEADGKTVKCTSIDSMRRWMAIRCTEGTCTECCWDINPVTTIDEITKSTHSVGITTGYRDQMRTCKDDHYRNWIAWQFSFNITMICAKEWVPVKQQNPPIQLSCDVDALH